MKIMFISDIHGSLFYLKQALEAFDREQGDLLVILGDQLYHGPRNDLPKDYNPKLAIPLLNNYREKIIAVRGNCDSEVDQMVLEYPIMADYHIITQRKRKIFLTHGHIYTPESLPTLNKGDIFISGHTHIPMGIKKDGIFILNPGSISIPKGNSDNSYGILEDDTFSLKDLLGNIIKKISLKS